MKAKTQSIIAVITGLVVTTAVGAALIPLMKMVLTNIYTNSFQKDLPRDVQIYGYIFLWTAISSFIGGYVTCWIAMERKVFAALLMGLLAFIILVLLGTVFGIASVSGVLTALTIIPLALMGGIVRQLVENKREDQNF
ncbi:hypothetical protein [Ferruginibacter sp. SUN106]|uniref:hypothetical protein n=1 Tax=Ferruginibacter sp. SUN106 TaxID=2978348 RepID=UPI003D360EF7